MLAPVEGVEVVGLDGGTARLGDHAPVELLVFVGQRFELGRVIRLSAYTQAELISELQLSTMKGWWCVVLGVPGRSTAFPG